MLGTKVEINLRKAGPESWSALEAPPRQKVEVIEAEEDDTDAAVASL